MKRQMIALLIGSFVTPAVVQAEPVRISLEWIELDCTKCPELATRFQPQDSTVGIADRTDPKFADLERAATKQVLVEHVTVMVVGTRARQTTRVGDTTFELELGLQSTGPDTYVTDVTASRSQGAAIAPNMKPGARLTREQMKGIRKANMAFRVGLVPGQTVVIGGLAKVGDARNKEKSPSKMLVLMMSLQGTTEAQRWPPSATSRR